uniref:Uncharacterized protein n=1 Tax=Anguilla anguilla TaxID=7936 RepID=A0A0E9W442_ANGAN
MSLTLSSSCSDPHELLYLILAVLIMEMYCMNGFIFMLYFFFTNLSFLSQCNGEK